MEKFILAQLILSLPGALISLVILCLIPNKPVLFTVIATITQAVVVILVSVRYGVTIQRMVGIDVDKKA